MYASLSFVISALFISSLIAFNFAAASGSTTGVNVNVLPFGVSVGVPPVGVPSAGAVPSAGPTTSVSTVNFLIFFFTNASLKLSTTVSPNSVALAFIPSTVSLNPSFIAEPIPENPFLIFDISSVKTPIIMSPILPKIPITAFANALKYVIIFLTINFATAKAVLNININALIPI